MVAVVSGSGLGLFGSSISTLGGAGASSGPGVGRGTDNVFVNTATGNLVVQSRDEFLSALGLDVSLARTYNSLGRMDDDNGDNWRLGIHQRVHGLTGTVNTSGSSVLKTFGDGREVRYTYDATLSRYVATDGDGAHDTLEFDGTLWTWTDGSSRTAEEYDVSGRLTLTRDIDGNEVTYGYGSGGLLTQITDESGQVTYLDYTGTNLTGIRVVSDGLTQTLTSYSYDTSNRLRQVTVDLTPQDNSTSDNVVYTTTYTYDGSSRRIARIEQADGSAVDFTYEEINGEFRLRTYTDAEGREVTLTYSTPSGTGSSSPTTVSSNPSALSTAGTQTYELDDDVLTSGGTWAVAQLLETSGTAASDAKIAFDEDGNGFAVWAQGADLLMRRYTAATNTWSTAVALDSGAATVYAPTLAVDAAGNAIVGWVQDDGTAASVFGNYFDATANTWTGAEILEVGATAVSTASGTLSAAVNGAYSVVTYAQSGNLYVSGYWNGDWFTADLVETGAAVAAQASVGVDDIGNITVVWQQSDGTASSVYLNRWDGETWVWDGELLLEGSSTAAGEPKIAFDVNGDGLAVWSQGNDVIARRFTRATNTWASAVTLDSRSDAAYSPQLAIDGATGNAIVAWVQSDGTANSVYVSRYTASANSWTSATAIESSSVAVTTGSDALSASMRAGFAAVAWTHTDGNMYAARFDGTTWGSAQLLESLSATAAQPSVAVDESGNVSVLWRQSDGAANSIYSRRFDVSGAPYYTVPSGATWQTLANTLYGVNSVAAGSALQTAMGSPTLTEGLQLTGWPATLEVTTTVPAYYTVQSGDTWADITLAVYGTSNANAAAALQNELGVLTPVTGQRLVMPATLTYVADAQSYPADPSEVSTSSTQTYELDDLVLTTGGSWSVAQLLESSGTAASDAKIAFDSDGNGFAVWAQGGDLMMRRYTASTNTWSTAVALDDDTATVYAPTLAVDAAGNAIVGWVQNDGTAASVFGNYYDAGTSTWTGAEILEVGATAVSTASGSLSAAVNGAYAVVTYVQNGNLYLSGYWETGWFTSDLVETGAAVAAQSSASVDDVGNITVVWQQSDGTASSVYVNRWDGDTWVWDGELLLEASSTAASDPKIAFDANGDGLAVWSQGNDVIARRYTRSTNTWASAVTLDSRSDAAYSPQLAIDAATGNAIVAWVQSDGTANSVYVSRFIDSTSSWTTAVAVESSSLAVVNGGDALSVSMRAGYAAVAWTHTDGNLYAARFNGTTWGGALLLEHAAPSASQPSVAVDEDGNVSVVWRQSDGTANSIYSRRFDIGGAPYYVVPAGATWQSLANTLYGVNSAAAGGALQTAMGNPTLSEGFQLTGWPATLDVTTTVPVYYTVQSGDTWGDITLAIYGTSDADVIAALQTALGTPTLSTGLELTVPLAITIGGSGSSAFYLQTDVEDALGGITTYVRDSQNRLIQVLSPTVNGTRLETQYEYDGDDNLVAIIEDPSGLNRRTTMTYDDNGNVLTTRDAAGRTVARTYDADNRLLTETRYAVADSDGSGPALPSAPMTSRYVYDAEGHLRYLISAEGHVSEYRYDAAGQRRVALNYVDELYTASAFGETDLNAWVLLQDATALERVDYAYDFRGNIESLTSYVTTNSSGVGTGAPSITNFVYDQRGQLLQTIDARGSSGTPDPEEANLPYATTFTYDGLGRLLASSRWISGSGVTTTTSVYDDADRRTSVTQENGLVTTSLYNRSGELVSVSRGTSSTPTSLGTTTYVYDEAGRLTGTIDPGGLRQFFIYDSNGRRVGQVDGDGSLTEFVYDGASQLVKTIEYAEEISAESLEDLAGSELVAWSTLRTEAGGIAHADARITRNVYDASGLRVFAVDPLGAVTRSIYDGAGRLIESVSYATPFAIATSVDALAPSDITVGADGEDRTSRYFYDGDDRLVGTLDAAGYLSEQVYDSAGRVIRTVAYANITESSLRAAGTLSQLRTSAGSDEETVVDPERDATTYFFYDGQGRQVGELDAAGYLTETVFDVAGNIAERIRYNKVLTYSTLSTLSSLRDAALASPAATTQSTSYEYDGAGRLVSQTDYQGTQTDLEYDAVGNLTRTTLAAGTTDERAATTRYDFLGRVIGQLSGEGSEALDQFLSANPGATPSQIDEIWSRFGTTYAYDLSGLRVSATTRPNDSQTNVTRYFYDNDGRLRFEVNELGERVEYIYNALNQRTDDLRYATALEPSTTAALTGGRLTPTLIGLLSANADVERDSRTTYTYTRTGLVNTVATMEGGQTTVSYNAFGEETARTQQITSTESVRHEYVRDNRGLVTELTRDAGVTGLNIVEFQQYDAFGRVTSRTDGNSNTASIEYDTLGRTIATVDALGGRRVIAYDAFSRTVRTIDALGNETTYAYNDTTRTTTLTTPEDVVVSTVANRHGQTLSVTAGGRTTSYDYDRDGLLTQTSDGLGTLEARSYDRAGREVTRADARGVLTQFAYDAANRVLTRTEDAASGGLARVTSYAYDDMGRLADVTDPTGTLTRTSYDRDSRVTEVIVDVGGLELTTTYAYDQQGQVVRVTEGAGSDNPRVTEYIYDALGRRTQEIVDPGTGRLNLTTQYFYDGNDNLTLRIDAELNSTWFAHDASNQIRYEIDALGGVTLTDYDVEGRVIARARLATPVDTELFGDVVTAEDIGLSWGVGDRVERSFYDGDGRKRFTMDALGGVTERTFDDNGNVIHERMYAETFTGEFDSLEDVVGDIELSAQDRQRWFAFDERNQLAFNVDALGAVVAYEYDANGNIARQVAFATPRSTSLSADLTSLRSWAQTTGIAGDSDNRITRFWYDAANREVYRQDAAGYVTETQHDDVARSTTMTLYAATATIPWSATTADIANRAGGVELPANSAADRSTTRERDAAGRVITVTDAAGTESYEYDAVGNKVGFTNRLGARWDYEYDANRRMIRERSPEVAITRVFDRLDTLPSGSAEPRGYSLGESTVTERIVTVIEYDALGNVVTRTEADGRDDARTTRYEYDALGRQIVTRLPPVDVLTAGAERGSTNDDRIGTEAELELYTRTIYDTFGNAIASFDTAGGVQQKMYDSLGRVTFEVDQERGVTEYRYDTFGNKTEVVRYGNPLYWYEEEDSTYTEDGDYYLRFGLERFDLGEWVPLTSSDLSENLWPDSEMDRTLSHEYDQVNRLVSTTQSAGLVFDPAVGQSGGQLVVASATTVNQYDAFGQMVRQSRLVSTASGGVWADTYFYYDARGLLSGQIDPLGYVTTHSYDAAGNRLTTAEYSRALTSGQWSVSEFTSPTPTTALTSLNNPAGYDRVTQWAYDQLNRKTSERLVDLAYQQISGTTVVDATDEDRVTTFGYDALGNLTRVTEASGATTFSYYDVLGRLTATAAPAKDVGGGTVLTPLARFARDAFGNLVVRREYAQGATTADEEGFTVTEHADDRITRMQMDSWGRVVKTQDAAGSNRYVAYDRQGKASLEWQPIYSLTEEVDDFVPLWMAYYDYDRTGRQTSILFDRPAGYGMDGGSAAVYMQYNVFGEMVVRSQNVPDFMPDTNTRFDYDQAGRLWRTNADDGVYRVYLYNLLGQATAEIRSQELDLSNYSAADAAALTSQRMRTETRYDLLGRIVEQRLPGFAATSAQGGLQVIGAQFLLEDDVLAPSNPDAVYSLGTRLINFGFGNLSFWLPSLNPEATVAQGGGYYYVPSTTGSAGRWEQDTSYQLEAGRYLHWAQPKEYTDSGAARSTDVSFEYRVAGSSGPWTTLEVAALPDQELGVDFGSFADGSYEYRIQYTRSGQLDPYAIATGTATIDGSTLSTVDTTIDTLTAANITPTAIIEQTPINGEFRDAQFRIGSFTGLSPIDDLVYRRVETGSLVSYVVDRESSPEDDGGYYRTASGYVQDPTYSYETSRFIRWQMPDDTELVAEFQFRSGGGGWMSREISVVGGDYSVAIGDVGENTYEFRVLYMAPVDPEDPVDPDAPPVPPVAMASGVFEIEPVNTDNSVALTADPADDAGQIAPIGNRPAGALQVTTEIVSSAQVDSVIGGQLVFAGNNNVRVRFPSITGAVRVELEYVTQTLTEEDEPGPTGTGWAGQPRRISMLIDDASNAASGINLIWRDPIAGQTAGGIDQVARVRVYSVASDGSSTLSYASDAADAASMSGTSLSWRAPVDTSIVGAFRVRAPGATTWDTLDVTRVNGDFTVDVSELGVTGEWEYEVTYTNAASVQRASATGRFVVSSGSAVNLAGTPSSGAIETVAPISGLVTAPVEFTLVSSATQEVVGPSYVVVGGQMQQHQPLQTDWQDTNQIDLTWADLGTGSVRVEVDYVSLPRYSFNYTNGNPPRWEESEVLVPGVATTRSFDRTGAATGTTISWDDDTGSVGGIQQINRIRVYTQVSGQWVLRYDRDAEAPHGGTTLFWSAPDDANVTAALNVRAVGSTSWQPVTVATDVAGWRSANLASLTSGDYEYQVVYSRTVSGVTTTSALSRGEFTIDTASASLTRSQSLEISQYNVAFDQGTNDFGPVDWDGSALTWDFAYQPGDTLILRTRVAGTSTWTNTSLTPAASMSAALGVATPGQILEYEIVYTSSGGSTGYAFTRGTLNRSIDTTSSPVTVRLSQTAGTTTPIAAVANVQSLDQFISWTTVPTSNTTITFRYQLEDDSWQTIAPTSLGSGRGYMVDTSELPPGSYRYEISYRNNSQVLPYAFSSGVMVVDGGSAGGQFSITDLTRYSESVVRSTSSGVPTQTQAFDRWGNVLSVTDALGNTTEYRYNQLNALIETRQAEVEVVDTTGGTVTTAVERAESRNYFDQLGRLIGTRDANGNLNSVAYNEAGQVLSQTHADGGVESYRYDIFGNQVQVTDELGYRTRSSYDRIDRLTSVQREVEANGFESGNPALIVTDAYLYNSAGNRLQETNGAGDVTRYTYDAYGNVSGKVNPDPEFDNWIYEYDPQDNKTGEYRPDGAYAEWEYDVFNRLQYHRDFAGTTYRYDYNWAGQLVHQTNSLGQDLRYEYDEAGHLIRVVDNGVAAPDAGVVSSHPPTE